MRKSFGGLQQQWVPKLLIYVLTQVDSNCQYLTERGMKVDFTRIGVTILSGVIV